MPQQYYPNMSPPISHLGGKSRLRRIIIRILPDDFTTWVEVFGGAMWVTFGKGKSRVEVYNDVDADLVNLWRCMQNKERVDEFLERATYLYASRKAYDDFINMHPADMTPVDRAIRYWYLMKLGFGAMVQSSMQIRGSFTQPPPGIDKEDIELTFRTAYNRTRKMWIEDLNFDELITKWDKKTTFFFCDPPYLDTKGYAGAHKPFGISEHRKLCSILKKIKGRFLFTINDHPEIREMYKEFNMREADVLYSMCKDKKGEVKELIFTNYEIKDQQLSFLDAMGDGAIREKRDQIMQIEKERKEAEEILASLNNGELPEINTDDISEQDTDSEFTWAGDEEDAF